MTCMKSGPLCWGGHDRLQSTRRSATCNVGGIFFFRFFLFRLFWLEASENSRVMVLFQRAKLKNLHPMIFRIGYVN